MYNNQTIMANRYGLDLRFYEYNDAGTIEENATPVAVIDFANEVSMELSSELIWATGGATHKNLVPFKNPTSGTFNINTQMVNTDILRLAAGQELTGGTTGKVSFNNDKASAMLKYYIIKGTTSWLDKEGTVYAETITVYKATVKPGYSVTYNGSGDPQSLQIAFELGTNGADQIVDIERVEDVANENE